jgi:hypothetical protein
MVTISARTDTILVNNPRKELIMGKLFKLLGILFVLSLLALPLAACRPWESGMHLIITVNTPQDGATVTTSPVTVSGTLSKLATVKINDILLPKKVSEFSTSIELTEGTNVINIVATSVDPDETVSKTVTVTYAPAK